MSDVFDSTPDAGQTAVCLQNAVLHKVVCLEHKNDFPIHLGVTISCIPAEETTRHGNKFALTTFSKTHNPFPVTLFEADAGSTEAQQWRSMYPQFNSNDLLNTVPAEVLATDNADQITNFIKTLTRQQHALNMRLELTYEIQTRT